MPLEQTIYTVVTLWFKMTSMKNILIIGITQRLNPQEVRKKPVDQVTFIQNVQGLSNSGLLS